MKVAVKERYGFKKFGRDAAIATVEKRIRPGDWIEYTIPGRNSYIPFRVGFIERNDKGFVLYHPNAYKCLSKDKLAQLIIKESKDLTPLILRAEELLFIKDTGYNIAMNINATINDYRFTNGTLILHCKLDLDDDEIIKRNGSDKIAITNSTACASQTTARFNITKLGRSVAIRQVELASIPGDWITLEATVPPSIQDMFQYGSHRIVSTVRTNAGFDVFSAYNYDAPHRNPANKLITLATLEEAIIFSEDKFFNAITREYPVTPSKLDRQDFVFSHGSLIIKRSKR